MKTSIQLKETVKENLRKGDVDSAVKNLTNSIENTTDPVLKRARNSLIILEGRYSKFKKRKINGTLKPEEESRQERIISDLILNFLDDLPNNFDDSSKSQNQTFDANNYNQKAYSTKSNKTYSSTTFNTRKNYEEENPRGTFGINHQDISDSSNFSVSSYFNKSSITSLLKKTNNIFALIVGFFLPITIIGIPFLLRSDSFNTKELAVSILIGNLIFIGLYIFIAIIDPALLL